MMDLVKANNAGHENVEQLGRQFFPASLHRTSGVRTWSASLVNARCTRQQVHVLLVRVGHVMDLCALTLVSAFQCLS